MKIDIISIEHDGPDAIDCTVVTDRGQPGEQLYAVRLRIEALVVGRELAPLAMPHAKVTTEVTRIEPEGASER
jgi:hypothetical protein